jgi:hypothetical protein
MNAIDLHITCLARRHGNFSAVARELRIDTRAFRRHRNGGVLSPLSRRVIVQAGKLLMLQELVARLRAQGVVTDKDLRTAWGAISPMREQLPEQRRGASWVSKSGRGHNDNA